MDIRTNKYRFEGGLWVALFLLLSACARPSDNEVVPEQNEPLFEAPAHFPPVTYTLDNNPITQAGFDLGKQLFFDPILSRDQSVSCNTCHVQSLAFADTPAHPISIGIDGRIGKRNAPSLANMAFFPDFFLDGGVNHLDFVAINAIELEFEMDESLGNVVDKLNNNSEYRSRFKTAFDIDSITAPFMLQALSQYMVCLVSDNSKYDTYARTGNLSVFSTLEQRGLEIFEGKCASCHSGTLQTDFSYRNNGLDTSFADLGRALITESDSDNGKFRVPSLRNIGLTAPYMHDGRFGTIDEVLNHYSQGVKASATLDPLLQQNGQLGILLSTEEKEALKAFFATLTDSEFRRNPKFQPND